MKKSLIALAVLGASGFAMAQSSVTLYGVANVGFGGAKGKSFQMMDQPDGTGSRFGLRGTEDLGGGLKVNFVLENGFMINDGTLDNAANKLFQRQSWAGVSGGFGEVRFGRQYTVGFDTSIWSMPATRTDAQLRTGLLFNGMGARNDNMIKYISPNFSGFTVEGSYVLKNNTGTKAIYELAASYGNGPIKANLMLAKVAGGNTGWGLNGQYNFGQFAVNGGYTRVAGVGVKSQDKGFHIGLTGNFGAVSPWLNVARNTHAKRTGVEVGANYALSKRTRLYGTYSHVNQNLGNVYGLGIAHSF